MPCPSGLDDVDRMAERLSEMGFAAASADTKSVADALRSAFQLKERLRDVWHAVEWRDSRDWSEEQAREQIIKYTSADSFGMLDGESFVACECDRTEDVRLEGGCIADGEVERLRALGWIYDGVTWVCPDHAKDIIAMVQHE